MSISTIAVNETSLDVLLQTLIETHGYDQVQQRLDAIAATTEVRRARMEREANPHYLLTLPPEQRERILAAAVEDALPLYKADLAKPEAERELTMDLETGDYYEYDGLEDDDAEAPHG